MKAKTINKVITAKVDDWIASIDDPAVAKLVKKNTIVTGGAIASMLLQEPVNDFDIYFKNRETALAVAHYYIGKFKPKNKAGIAVPLYVDEADPDRIKIVVRSSGIASEEGTEKPYRYFEGVNDGGVAASQYVTEIIGNPGEIEDTYDDLNEKAQEIEDGEKYRPVFMSTNAITLSHKIQLVLRFYGEPDEIHHNYDFSHCTNYWTSWVDQEDASKKQLVLRQDALEALLARELRYVGSKYPLCSIMRIRKFIKRGWTINAGQILKAVMQLNDLNLKDMTVLRDQLTGVDSAYFAEVIAKLADKDPEKVNTAYLIEVIDRMF